MFNSLSKKDRIILEDIAERNAILCRGECQKGNNFVDDCPYLVNKDAKCQLLEQAKQLQIHIEMNYRNAEVK